MNPRMLRALTITFSASFVFAVLAVVVVIFKKPTIEQTRLLGIVAIVFWICLYVLVRYYLRAWKTSVDSSRALPTGAVRSVFAELASRIGKLFLASGTLGVLIGAAARAAANRYAISLLTAGVVTCGFGAYLLLLAKKSARDVNKG